MSRKTKITSIHENPSYPCDTDDSDIIPVRKSKKRIFSSSESDNDFSTHDNSSAEDLLRKPEENIDNFEAECNFPDWSKPIHYFDLFFDSELLSLMVIETNNYAEYSRSLFEPSDLSKLPKWTPVTELELKAFIAMILEMGITRRPSITSYWSKNSRQIPWFKKMFSRNRFQEILKYFHLVDSSLCFPPSHPNYDPCVRFEPLVKHANKVFKLYYTPHKELSIDESLVGTLCHSSITQYLPNKKHHRWGIKFWMLCDAISKYCLTFYCYKGAKSRNNSDNNTFGLGYNVVINLLNESNCLHQGYHVFVDNFFSSIELARYLYSNNTYLTGTIRRNKKCIPDHLKTVNVNEPKYFKDNNVLLCAYREKKSVKKPVILISTKCEEKNLTITKKKHGREWHSTKPAIIHSYNTFMGGVDESDKMLYAYLDERRTVKYWKKVAFNIMNRMVLNAYIIYKKNANNRAMTRLDFISRIIFDIGREWMKEKRVRVFQRDFLDENRPRLVKLPQRNLRNCVVCSTKNKRKRSHLICVQCEKGVHPTCYHKHQCFT